MMNMNFEEEKKDNTWDIVIVLAGLAFLFWILKSNQQKTQSAQEQYIQPQQSIQSQQYLQESYQPTSRYENAENWEVVRSDDGFITNVRALRDATVGNGTYNSKSEHKFEQSEHKSLLDTSNMSGADIDKYIDNRVKQMLQKNMEGMDDYNSRFSRFAMLSDRDRMNRFGLM
jgi:hypothetical protein